MNGLAIDYNPAFTFAPLIACSLFLFMQSFADATRRWRSLRVAGALSQFTTHRHFTPLLSEAKRRDFPELSHAVQSRLYSSPYVCQESLMRLPQNYDPSSLHLPSSCEGCFSFFPSCFFADGLLSYLTTALVSHFLSA